MTTNKRSEAEELEIRSVEAAVFDSEYDLGWMTNEIANFELDKRDVLSVFYWRVFNAIHFDGVFAKPYESLNYFLRLEVEEFDEQRRALTLMSTGLTAIALVHRLYCSSVKAAYEIKVRNEPVLWAASIAKLEPKSFVVLLGQYLDDEYGVRFKYADRLRLAFNLSHLFLEGAVDSAQLIKEVVEQSVNEFVTATLGLEKATEPYVIEVEEPKAKEKTGDDDESPIVVDEDPAGFDEDKADAEQAVLRLADIPTASCDIEIHEHRKVPIVSNLPAVLDDLDKKVLKFYGLTAMYPLEPRIVQHSAISVPVNLMTTILTMSLWEENAIRRMADRQLNDTMTELFEKYSSLGIEGVNRESKTIGAEVDSRVIRPLENYLTRQSLKAVLLASRISNRLALEKQLVRRMRLVAIQPISLSSAIQALSSGSFKSSLAEGLNKDGFAEYPSWLCAPSARQMETEVSQAMEKLCGNWSKRFRKLMSTADRS